MRRLVSILLLVVLALPLCAPLLAQTAEDRLPACCRRDGAHHCMRMMAESSPDRPEARATCPAYPRAASVGAMAVWTFTPLTASTHELAVEPAAVGQVEAGYRIATGRSRHKRGPPTQNT